MSHKKLVYEAHGENSHSWAANTHQYENKTTGSKHLYLLEAYSEL